MRLGDLTGLIEPKVGRKYLLNLWKANQCQLRQVGVEDIRIMAGICTVCHHDRFSYRGRGNTGRFGAGIMLNIDGMLENFYYYGFIYWVNVAGW